MALLDDLGTYLAANVGSLTLGTNLFLGRMPDDPDTCVTLYEYSGNDPVNVMGGDAMPPVEQPRVQVATRAAGYATAHDLAYTCWTQLEGVLNETLTSTLYHRVEALQSPFPLSRDAQDRVVFAQNYQVIKST